MCEYLFLARKAGAYDHGDCINTRKDGAAWGKEELNSDKFFIVKVPGQSLPNAAKLKLNKSGVKSTLVTRELCRDDWNKAVKTGKFKEFKTKPTVKKERIVEDTRLINSVEFSESEKSGNYSPYMSRPHALTKMSNGDYLVTGNIDIISVEGMISGQGKPRMKYFDISNLSTIKAKELEDQAQDGNALTLNRNDFLNCLKEKAV